MLWMNKVNSLTHFKGIKVQIWNKYIIVGSLNLFIPILQYLLYFLSFVFKGREIQRKYDMTHLFKYCIQVWKFAFCENLQPNLKLISKKSFKKLSGFSIILYEIFLQNYCLCLQICLSNYFHTFISVQC